MAATCPIGFDVDGLRAQVLATYERVARDPSGDFHFHRGPRYAAVYLRYDAGELALLPDMLVVIPALYYVAYRNRLGPIL
jgi:arsenite methyltransferase